MQWNYKIKFTFYAKNLAFYSIIPQLREGVCEFKAELQDQILYTVLGSVNFILRDDKIEFLYHANKFGFKPIKALKEWRGEI